MDQKNKDQLDEWFEKLAKEDSLLSKTIAGIGSEVKKGIDDTIKKGGYNSFQEMVSDQASQFGKKIEGQARQYQARKNEMTRYEMVKIELEKSVAFHFRVEFRQGYRDAIIRALRTIEEHKQHLLYVEDRTRYEIKQLVVRKNDFYTRGYFEGMKKVLSILEKSKMIMMNKVRESLYQ